jgi:hypothetical protein
MAIIDNFFSLLIHEHNRKLKENKERLNLPKNE